MGCISICFVAMLLPFSRAFVTSSRRLCGRQQERQVILNFDRQVETRGHYKRATGATSVCVSITNVSFQTVCFATSATGRTSATTEKPFKLVVVESPSKAKTISKILNSHVQENNLSYSFVVDSCAGHVRDLPWSASQVTSAKFKNKVLGINVQDGNFEPHYIVLPKKKEILLRLKGLACQCEELILATDQDREGEAIAWHLSQLILLPTITLLTRRVTFSEITQSAIIDAFFCSSSSRDTMDNNLVQAQETRRILDRLAGYTLSPLLWKKIAPGLSAGRVQSVGMALVVNRERQRMRFVESEYWNVKGLFSTFGAETLNLEATLIEVNGTKLASGRDFDGETGLIIIKSDATSKTDATNRTLLHHMKKKDAADLIDTFSGLTAGRHDFDLSQWTITSIQTISRSNRPPLPFTTSTLQQEANKRLGLSVGDTMRCAQLLYENGYITYMRTDNTCLSQDAVHAGTKVVEKEFGKDYIASKTVPLKTNRSRNANIEAHESIRPSIQDGTFVDPTSLLDHFRHKDMEGGGSNMLSSAVVSLYDLIYKRTSASLMKNQILNQTTVNVEGVSSDNMTVTTFRANGNVVVFPGFTKVWKNSNNDEVEENVSKLPSNLSIGQKLKCRNLVALDHHTKPPSRFTEASFVKELESLGVGRPSTYANVVQTLRHRAYIGSPVQADESARARSGGRRKTALSKSMISAHRAAGDEEFIGNGRGPLVPSLSAFVVCSLLEKYCPSYVDPSFTAEMEDRLDKIAQGGGSDVNTKISYLEEYYGGDNGLAAQVDRMDKSVSADDARRARIPSLSKLSKGNSTEVEIGLFVGPWGPYVQKVVIDKSSGDKPLTAALPMGMAADISTITPGVLAKLLSSQETGGIVLGTNPGDGRVIRLKYGRHGAYLQCGEPGEEGSTKHTLPKHIGGLGGRNINFQDSTYENDTSETMGNSDENNKEAAEASKKSRATFGLTLQEAIGYVNLPRTICNYQDLPITAAIGSYGPYLKFNNSFVSLNSKDGDVLTINSENAIRVVTNGIINKKTKMGRGVLAVLGEKNSSVVKIKDGKFGTYLNWKDVNAKLPPRYHESPSKLSLEEAWNLIVEKIGFEGVDKRILGKSRQQKSGATTSSVSLPPQPKRPISAYLHFCAEKRPEVSKFAKTLGEVSKELAKQWAKTADSSNRTYYENLASMDKEKYALKKIAWEEECAKLLKNADTSAKVAKGNHKQHEEDSKEDYMPKKPLSAYLHFCADHRVNVNKSVTTFGGVSKELARRWAETVTNGGKGRQKYEKLAAADKRRYEEEMAKHNNATATISGNDDVFATSEDVTKKLVKRRSDDEGASSHKSQRAPSAYMLFCSANRKHVMLDAEKESGGNKLTFGESVKRLAELWNTCDDTTRLDFVQRAAAIQEKRKRNE